MNIASNPELFVRGLDLAMYDTSSHIARESRTIHIRYFIGPNLMKRFHGLPSCLYTFYRSWALGRKEAMGGHSISVLTQCFEHFCNKPTLLYFTLLYLTAFSILAMLSSERGNHNGLRICLRSRTTFAAFLPRLKKVPGRFFVFM